MPHKLEITLSDRHFLALTQKARDLNLSEDDLIERALGIFLQVRSEVPLEVPADAMSIRLGEMESRLIELIHQTIELRMKDLEIEPKIPLEIKEAEEIKQADYANIHPNIHQLQIGDMVQILDADSAYFKSILPIVKVGMIRASVQTLTGESSFLKRDLRFQRSPIA
jgi:hypothetical protein